MSTAIVEGGPAWSDGTVDGDGNKGRYRNRIETDRLRIFHTYHRQGIVYGGELTPVAGQMLLEVTGPWLGMVEERDSAGTPNTGRGYEVWDSETTVTSFDVASASDRMDALVIAFVDVEAGAAAFGTETAVVGGQAVVVTGVSGTTTPRTDSQIQDAVGSGGWVRVADVLIKSTDTEINPANITEHAAADGRTPIAVLTTSGIQTIPDATVTEVAFDTAQTQGHITFSGNTVVIEVAGYYDVAGSLGIDGGGGGNRRMRVKKNSSVLAGNSDGADAALGVRALDVSGGDFMEPGDVVSLDIFHNAGSSVDLSGLGGLPRLTVARRA